MLALLTPATPCRVTLLAEDGVHAVSSEIPVGQDFDRTSLSAYEPFDLVSVETFPLPFVVTARFEHLSDLDPWEWEAGQRLTSVVSFAHETGKLSPTELTQLKASHTGFRLVGLYADRITTSAETEF